MAVVGDFAALLEKEFRPKSERSREEVEGAVRTLAEQALRSAVIISPDVSQTIQSLIAEIDKSSASRSIRSFIMPTSRKSRARGGVCTIWLTIPKQTKC